MPSDGSVDREIRSSEYRWLQEYADVMNRRLAAVLMADVVGYSRLMEADEAGTLAALKQRRAEILQPVVRDHGGRIVKVMGDGVLIEFASAVNAVAAALELQRRMAEANAACPRPPHPAAHRRQSRRRDRRGRRHLRRGRQHRRPPGEPRRARRHLHLGQRVRRGPRQGSPPRFEDLGEQSVKNLSRPVRAYRVRPRATATAPQARARCRSLPDKPSIAVLPFQNMSGDPDQEYFADGMVEDIITELARLPWLFVIARNSSFTYKGRAVDVKQVGRELGVRYVLEGSVRRAGGRVRITGQLIDAATGAHLWADRFDGELADVFDLQDRVTASVVGVIAPTPGAGRDRARQAQADREPRAPTTTTCAAWRRSIASARRTMPRRWRCSPRPSNSIPTMPSAYAMAARCYLQRKGFGWVADRERGDRRDPAAGAARRRARPRRRGDAGQCRHGPRSSSPAISTTGRPCSTRRSALNQNLAWVWHFSALAKAFLGEPEAAIEQAARAMRLSPQDPQTFAMQMVVGQAHFPGPLRRGVGLGRGRPCATGPTS